jgi:hypothetical protein
VGPYPVWGTWFPNHFPLEGTGPYIEFWVVTESPWNPGYKTPTVAPEPFIEWVVGAIHSTGDIIGTYMSLRVLLQDSVVRPWG